MGKTTRFNDIEITWLGHAGFMIKAVGKTVYIDPYKVTHGEKADLILVTHEHYDHCDPSSISMLLKDDTIVIGPCEVKNKIDRTRTIKVNNSIDLDCFKIFAVPAYNREKSFHPQGCGVGFVITVDGVRIYHAGDTDMIPEMGEILDIDIALLPVGGTYTMNAHEAAEAAKTISPKLAIPMHWGDIIGTRRDAEDFSKLAETKVEILD